MAQKKDGSIVRLTMEEQHSLVGCARICVEYEPTFTTWAKYRHVSKLPYVELDYMEKFAEKIDAIKTDWYCVFESVKKNKWISVEFWDGEKWRSYEEVN